jgi:hypothetical protein
VELKSLSLGDNLLNILFRIVALGGLVVSVLATGPKESRRSHVVGLRHVKEPNEHERDVS